MHMYIHIYIYISLPCKMHSGHILTLKGLLSWMLAPIRSKVLSDQGPECGYEFPNIRSLYFPT